MKRQGIFTVFLICAMFLCACSGLRSAPPENKLHIALPAIDGMEDVQNNYYKNWLSLQTGIELELELIPPEYMPKYLRMLFTSENESNIDLVFLNGDYISASALAEYGRTGCIQAIDELLQRPNSQLTRAVQEFPNLQKGMAAPNGHYYFMPNISYSEVFETSQVLWLNQEWLESCNLTLPKTTEEFETMLRAFKERDPNGNGIADEQPLAGTMDTHAQNIIYFVMNAFVYTDPDSAFLNVTNGKVSFAPASEEWREGLKYLHHLHSNGLLPKSCLTFSKEQSSRMINDPRNITGGFAAGNSSDVLATNSPMLLNRYRFVPPLLGPQSAQYATVRTNKPQPGGIITKYCDNKEAALTLMDFMLSPQAGEIASNADKSVNWNNAQLGPYIGYPAFGNAVDFHGDTNGLLSQNAKAAMAYQVYQPAEYAHDFTLPPEMDEIRSEVSFFAELQAAKFVSGIQDIYSDADWAEYLAQLDSMGLKQFLQAAQTAYRISE